MNTHFGHCKVLFKGQLRFGIIIESKLDKLKVSILDGISAGSGSVIKSDWFEKHEVKRIWL